MRRREGESRTRRPATGPVGGPDSDRGGLLRALLIGVRDAECERIGPVLSDRGLVVERGLGVDDARAALARSKRRPDVLVFVVGRGDDAAPAMGLVRELSSSLASVACVIVSSEPTLETAVEAMRAGAVDLIDAMGGPGAIGPAVDLAVERVLLAREREVRIDRLRGVCKRLDSARQDMTEHVSSMCTDLVDAYRELSTQIDRVTLVSEFNGIVRQELEIESLLRVALEFLLAKIGAANAAVFLPSSSDEFSLGAFVNYDREGEAMSVLLDQLGDSLAPRLEERGGVVFGSVPGEIDEVLGEHAHWLESQHSVAAACEHDGECLAVLVMFRDRRSPLPDKALAIFETLAPPFAQQLGRIIHVHHRHIPKDQWSTLGDDPIDFDDDEWDDLAA